MLTSASSTDSLSPQGTPSKERAIHPSASPLLSFSLALAMAEAGPGRSETVTETTVTVTTEPVSKAGGVMRCLRVWKAPGREGIDRPLGSVRDGLGLTCTEEVGWWEASKGILGVA